MYLLRTNKLVSFALLAFGLCASAAQAGSDADADYDAAKTAYDNQQWEAAANELQVYLGRHSGHSHATKAHFFLAEALVQLRRHEAAHEMYDRYLQMQSDVTFAAFARYRLGETAYLLQDYERAAARFNEYVELHPEHKLTPNASRYLGEIALDRDESQAAADWFRRAIRAAQNHSVPPSFTPSVRFGLARASEFTDTDFARRLYDELIAEFPGPFAARAQIFAGMMEHRIGRDTPADVEAFRRARRRFETFLNAYPDDENRVSARYWLGRTLLKLGDYDAAANEFDTASRESPVHELAPDLHFLAGESLRRAGKQTAAQRFYEDVCRNWPTSRFAAQAKARLAALNPSSTASDISQTQQQPQNLITHARRLIAANDFSGALELLSSIEPNHPKFALQHEVDYLIGQCYASDMQMHAARAAFGKVIRSTSGAKSETAALAQWMIADTHQQEQNYQQAIREFLRVSVLYDGFPNWQASALLGAGNCFERLGDERSADNAYAQLIDRFGESSFAREAAERLHRDKPHRSDEEGEFSRRVGSTESLVPPRKLGGDGNSSAAMTHIATGVVKWRCPTRLCFKTRIWTA